MLTITAGLVLCLAAIGGCASAAQPAPEIPQFDGKRAFEHLREDAATFQATDAT